MTDMLFPWGSRQNDALSAAMPTSSSFWDIDILKLEQGVTSSTLVPGRITVARERDSSLLTSIAPATNVTTFPSFSEPPSPLGNLSKLPRELRDLIIAKVVTGKGPSPHDFGKSSGLNTAILRTNSQLREESIELLYKASLTIPVTANTCGDCPPSAALAQMVHLTLEVTFRTQNRGVSQMSIHDAGKLKCILEYVALSLRRSRHLKDLEIVLLNEAQRKANGAQIRADLVRETIRGLLKPFAALPRRTKIKISGFDTLEYVEIFDQLRNSFAGTDMLTEELCDLDIS